MGLPNNITTVCSGCWCSTQPSDSICYSNLFIYESVALHYTDLLNHLCLGWGYSSISNVIDSCVLGDGSLNVVSSSPGEVIQKKTLFRVYTFFHI